MLETWKVAPALATGNTVVLKPAEGSPLTANKLAEIIDEAGLPRGVFNVVHGFGETAGAALVAHPDVRLISRLPARRRPAWRSSATARQR